MGGSQGWTRSKPVAGLVGGFAGGIVILLLESAGHRLLGTAGPGDLAAVTPAMFASVLVAWLVGSAVAGALATYWARASTVGLGAVVGVVLLGGAVANFIAFPHPMWMIVAAVVGMPAAAVWAASRALKATAPGG